MANPIQRDTIPDRIGNAFYYVFIVLSFLVGGAIAAGDTILGGLAVGILIYVTGFGIRYLITGRTD